MCVSAKAYAMRGAGAKEREARGRDENIKVLLRIRPASDVERACPHGYRKAVHASDDGRSAKLAMPGAGEDGAGKTFTFDAVVDESASQARVFDLVGRPIADAFLDGYHSNLLAYGQTGAGKTYTMQGPGASSADAESADAAAFGSEERGLVPRVLEHVFASLASEADKMGEREDGASFRYAASCSFLEIYNECLYDLLDPSGVRPGGEAPGSANVTVREDSKRGVVLEGAVSTPVADAAAAFALFTRGGKDRRTGATAANSESSRSHSVFILTVEQTRSPPSGQGLPKRTRASFYLVDLAGSERQKHSEAVGQTLKEACGINKSLSALGNVIKSLVDARNAPDRDGYGRHAGAHRHIPYRDSKLTFLLKNSFGGKSKCSLIANVSPALVASEETLGTLKFAQRAKLVKNAASKAVCEDGLNSAPALQAEVKRLRAELDSMQRNAPQAAGPAWADPAASNAAAAAALDPEARERIASLQRLLLSEKRDMGARKADMDAERAALEARADGLQKLCAKLEMSLKSTKLVVRLREQSLERMSGKLPETPALFWEAEGGAAILENRELKQMLDCPPEVIKCRMEVDALKGREAALELRLQADVEAKIFAFKEKAATAMGELYSLLSDKEGLTDEAEALRTKLAAQAQEHSDAQAAGAREAAAARASIAELETKCARQDAELARTTGDYESKLAEMQANFRRSIELRQEVEGARAKLMEDLDSQRAAHDARVAKMEADAVAEREALTQRLEELGAAMEAAEQTHRTALAAQEKEAAQAASELRAAIADVTADRDALIHRTEELGTAMEAAEETHRATLAAQEEAGAQAAEVAAQAYAELRAAMEDVTAERDALAQRTEKLGAAMEAAEQTHAGAIAEERAQAEGLRAAMAEQAKHDAASLGALEAQAASLGDELAAATAAKAALERAAEGLRADLDAQAARMAELASERAAQAEAGAARDRAHAEASAALEARIAALSDATKQAEIDATTAQEALQNTQAAMTQRTEELEAAMESAEQTHRAALAAQKEAGAQAAEEAAQAYAELRATMGRQAERDAAALGALEAQAASLREEAAAATAATAEAEDQAASLASEVASLRTQGAALALERDGLRSACEKAEGLREEAVSEAEAKAARCVELESALASQAQAREDADAAHAAALLAREQEAAEAREGRSAAEADVARLSAGAEETAAMEAAHRQALDASEARAASMATQIGDLRAALDAATEGLKAADAMRCEVASSAAADLTALADEITAVAAGVRGVSSLREDAAALASTVRSSQSAEQVNAALRTLRAQHASSQEALLAAQAREAALQMKRRQSLSDEAEAKAALSLAEGRCAEAEASRDAMANKLSALHDELGRVKHLYAQSQEERRQQDGEYERLANQVEVEAARRQSAVMAKVQSEAKRAEAEDEAAGVRQELTARLREQQQATEAMRRKAKALEERLSGAGAGSPATPRGRGRVNVLAKRRPFGELSNRQGVKAIELTPKEKGGGAGAGAGGSPPTPASSGKDKAGQLQQVKQHLSAIENAIHSRTNTRYALRTRGAAKPNYRV